MKLTPSSFFFLVTTRPTKISQVRLNGYAYPGQPVPRRIETIVVIPTWTGGGKRFEAGVSFSFFGFKYFFPSPH